MARWRLTDAHYLAVEGTEWEYKEQNRETGRQAPKGLRGPSTSRSGTLPITTTLKMKSIIVSNKFDGAHQGIMSSVELLRLIWNRWTLEWAQATYLIRKGSIGSAHLA